MKWRKAVKLGWLAEASDQYKVWREQYGLSTLE